MTALAGGAAACFLLLPAPPVKILPSPDELDI